MPAPIAQEGTYGGFEDELINGQVSASDDDGDMLTYSLVAGPSFGTMLSFTAEGFFAYQPDPNFSGMDSFTFMASDGTESSTATNGLSVLPVNDAPVAIDASVSVNEDQPVSGHVFANDVEGDPLTFVLWSSPLSGTLDFQPDGSYTYTPGPDFSGTDSFEFFAADASSGPLATVTLVVSAVNDAPVADDASFVIQQDQSVSSSVSASDVEGDLLGFSLASGPSHGELVFNPDGSFLYTPAAGYAGLDFFTFTASDGQASSGEGTVGFLMEHVNAAPVAQGAQVSLDEDSSYAGQAVGTDADGDPLRYELMQGPASGTVDFSADGSFLYTPNADYDGSDGFWFAVSDGAQWSDWALVELDMLPVNDAPVADSASAETSEGVQLSSFVSGSDVDGDGITFVLVSGALNGDVQLFPDGSYLYTPAAGFVGTDNFSFAADDGLLASEPATVTLTVGPVNEAPVAEGSAVSLDEDTSHAGQALASDPDGDLLGFELMVGAGAGMLQFNPDGSYVYTPGADFNGSDSFWFAANDGALWSNWALVEISVLPVNDAPVAESATAETAQGTPFSGFVTGSDVDGDAITFALVSGPSSGELQLGSDGSYLYTPFAGFNGFDSFSFLADDGALTSEAATVSIGVGAVNWAPVADSAAVTLEEDTFLAGQASATDADGDPLTYALQQGPSAGTLDFNADGSYLYTPNADYSGGDGFWFAVHDGELWSDWALIDVQVTPVNDAPVALADAWELDEDGLVSSAVVASDIDGDALTFSVAAGVAHGELFFFPDGSYVYFPDADYAGEDSFTFQASDGNATSAVETVSFTMLPVNDAPVGVEDSVATDEDTPLAGQLAATDAEGDPVQYQQWWGPFSGTLVLDPSGSYLYTPNEDFFGSDEFWFQGSDGQLTGEPVRVAITIASVNDAPVAEDLALATDEDQPITAFAAATDVDGDPLVRTVLEGPLHGQLVLGADGWFTYTPDANYSGPDSFTWQASDAFITGNLIYNPDAELGPSASDWGTDVAPEGWTVTTGSLSVVDYAIGGDVDLNPGDSQGEDDASYFTGGTASDASGISQAVQSIYVGWYAGAIDRGEVMVNLSGAFGGWFAQDDSMTLTAVYLDGGGNQLGRTDIGAVLAADRLDDSSLLFREAQVAAPVGTRYIDVALTAIRTDGSYNDGYADHLSLTLSSAAAGASSTGTVTIDVLPVNDAPQATGISLTTGEDVALAGQVDATDAEGDPLTYELWSGTGGGLVALEADGSFVYTPDADFNGTDTFWYFATDGTGFSEIVPVVIVVEPVNDAPVGLDAAFEFFEDQGGFGFTSASDVDGDPLVHEVVAGPLHGTISLDATGLFFYAPDADFFGEDSFTFQASDGTAASEVQTISLSVLPLDDAPVAEDASVTTDEDTPLAGQAVARDVDDDALTYHLWWGPFAGSLAFNPDGSYVYTPAPNFHGSDVFWFYANDGLADGNLGTVSIAVTSVNDAPVAEPVMVEALEDQPFFGFLSASDVDGDLLVFSVVAGPAHGELQLNDNGFYAYLPDAGFAGEDSFSFSASDGVAASGATLVSINVAARNDAPVAVDQLLTVTEDEPLAGQAQASDADGDPLSFFLWSQPRHGSLAFEADGSYVYTPFENFNGADSFAFGAMDVQAGSNIATIELDVQPVNDVPVITPGSLAIFEDQQVLGFAQGSDADAETLQFSVVDGPAHGTLEFNGDGSFLYTPDANFHGSDFFTFQASDGFGASGVADFAILVEAVNDAPVSVDAQFAAGQGQSVSGQAVATDPDGDAVRFFLFSSPFAGTVVFEEDGSFVYTASPFFTGTDSFLFAATDGSSFGNVAQVFVTVDDANNAPEAIDQAIVTNEDMEVGGHVLANDADGDALTYALAAAPLHGTVVLRSDGSFTYTPDADFNGTDSFSFVASDGAAQDEGVKTIVVSPVNDAPVAHAATASTDEGSALAGQVGADDVDGNLVTFTVAVGAEHGTVTMDSTGAYTYTPAAGFSGTDSFTFRASDGEFESDAVVTLDVGAHNDAPVATGASFAGHEDQVLAGQVGAVDADGDALTFSLVGAPAHGSIVFRPDGSFAYTPDADFHGSDSFLFRASDGTAQSEAASATIELMAMDDAPTGTVSISGIAMVGRTLTASDTLADADGLGTVSYQWLADGEAIGGATGDTLELGAAQAGRAITVRASYTDLDGNFTAVGSLATPPVADATVLDGMAYHWKNHALLSGVAVQATSRTALEAGSSLIDLRDAHYDAATHTVTVQVWANPTAASSSLDFSVRSAAATGMSFASALGSEWTLESANDAPGSLAVAAAILGENEPAGATQAMQVGTLTIDFAAGTTAANVEFGRLALGDSVQGGFSVGFAAQSTGADGRFSFAALPDGSYVLGASRGTGDVGNAVTSADALAALRLAVGINPNPDPDGAAGPRTPLKVSPYQVIAADANADGKVTSADALAILRMAVKSPLAPPSKWDFVSEALDLWNEGTNGSQLTRTNALWDRSLNAQLLQDTSLNMIGVLRGDVNGSWTAPSGSEVLPAAYFTALAVQQAVPTDVWGI